MPNDRLLKVAEQLGKPSATLVHTVDPAPMPDFTKWSYDDLYARQSDLQRLIQTWREDAQRHRAQRRAEVSVDFEDKARQSELELTRVMRELRIRIARDMAHP